MQKTKKAGIVIGIFSYLGCKGKFLRGQNP
jgi:hypothetical protein